MAITNERIRQMVFDAQTDPAEKFIVLALEALLESQVGAGATDAILDTFIPVAPTMQLVLFGRKIGDYSGLSRAQLKAIFTEADGVTPLTDADVDAIFAALGAVSGLGAENPFGEETDTNAAGGQEFVDSDTSGSASQEFEDDEPKGASLNKTEKKSDVKAKSPEKKGDKK